MTTRTILLHGWSDTGASFRAMKRFLVRAGIGAVEEVLFADYESREDSLSFGDVVDGLNDQMIARGIIASDGTPKHDVNVVVHSTGGLVIRHWIWRYYRQGGDRLDACPVRRIVMLAPANFGSPLAHRGKSFLGSLLKGRRGLDDFLEVGRQILDGLELASPYQWALAERDTLFPASYYVPDRIQLTVLVGAEGYAGLRGIVNKPGTDGTVVIAGTALDAVKFTLDPCRPDGDAGRAYDWRGTTTGNRHAFAVLPEYDHGRIVSDFGASTAGAVPELVRRALTLPDPAAFREFIDELRDRTRQDTTQHGRSPYQQFIVRAVDDQGAPVDDYTLEFYVRRRSVVGRNGWLDSGHRPTGAERKHSEAANRLLFAEAHENRTQHSYRRFLVDHEAVARLLEGAEEEVREPVTLAMRVHVPPVDRGIRYRTDRLQAVELAPTVGADGGEGPTLLFPDTTTFLEVKVDRFNDYVHLGTKPHER